MYTNKRFYSYSQFLKDKFGKKVFKVPVSLANTCPNRDGTKGYGGCIFCSENGSGDFLEDNYLSIKEQFLISTSKDKKWNTDKFIIYFQSFTNTYLPINILENAIIESLEIDGVVGISIGTRPDCISPEIIDLLTKYNKKTFISVELGLQTSNDKTHALINSCFTTDDYISSMALLKAKNINTVTHVILGLPHENYNDYMNTIKTVISAKTDGIKLQLMYILKRTVLADMFIKGEFSELGFNDYINLIVDILEILPKEMVIHRLTGDAKKDDLIAPLYSLNKRNILNSIDKELIRRNSYQSINFSK